MLLDKRHLHLLTPTEGGAFTFTDRAEVDAFTFAAGPEFDAFAFAVGAGVSKSYVVVSTLVYSPGAKNK